MNEGEEIPYYPRDATKAQRSGAGLARVVRSCHGGVESMVRVVRVVRDVLR
jgi:hypothetical protein